jgi:hypothetical protein
MSVVLCALRVDWEGEVQDEAASPVPLRYHGHGGDFQLPGAELLEVRPEDDSGETRIHLVLNVLMD